MSVKITWLGHATWTIEAGDHTILLDPFLTENPVATVSPEDLSPNFILISHGHADHIADAAAIAQRTGAQVISIFEVAQWLGNQGVENCVGMNIGGSFGTPFGSVKMVRAEHSSSFPDGSYAGCPAGFLLTIDDQKIYFACDTGLFSDMKLIGEADLDIAVLPIGDLFTMGPAEAVTATQWLNPKHVLPTHYNTWPPIEQDTEAWAEQVRLNTTSTPHVLAVGEAFING